MRWHEKRSVAVVTHAVAMLSAAVVVSTLSVAGCGPTCPENQDVCDGQCTILTIDHQNCGSCGKACADGEICNAGQCAVTCQAPQKNCDGQCKDVRNDSQNCGACGTACGTGFICGNGVCSLNCPGGSTKCG
ncbi:MAG: hypothetical protein ACT4TC_02400, partial [Myxococcaceae bacterium]